MRLQPQPFLTLFLIISSLLLPASAPAKVAYVAQNATGDGDGSTWENACTTITAGLLTSASGDEVWVKSATYHEAIRLRKGVSLYGGFAGGESQREQRDWASRPTIIDATGLGKSAVKGANAILDGFTITGGSADMGGGISTGLSSLIIENCTIRGNTAIRGAGVHLGSEFSEIDISQYPSPKLVNCRIIGNSSSFWGGGVFSEHVLLSISQCVIMNNFAKAIGGGISSRNSCGIITDCKISENRTESSGGGVYVFSDGYVYTECRSSQGEVPADCAKISPTFVSCLIADNHTEKRGGGIYCDQITPTFTNCTIAGNDGGGIYSSLYFHYVDWVGHGYPEDVLLCGCQSVPSLVNCIVWNDEAITIEWRDGLREGEDDPPMPYDPGVEGLNVTGSCIQGGWYGQALDVDPMFVDPEDGDYRLQSGSPCIDSGTNEGVQDIPLDLDGRIRIWNGQVDIGAYEFDSAFPTPTPPPVQLWLLDGLGRVRRLPAPTP